ncbi:MAG: SpoIID/LytB domain-containing protein [Ruminiclostridium sp.]|nr:SpoIID/LytB domain-containing protein [Ruminiclostridium sp.]
MKDMLIILAMFAAAIFALPLLAQSAGTSPAAQVTMTAEFPDEVRIYLTDAQETVTVTAEEYLEGCLAAQIPINYRPEALKAQAAASATYALRLIAELAASGKLPDGADISDDRQLCQPYMPPAERKSTYGADYAEYRENLQAAARYGLSHIILSEGEPIYAVYHSVSAGGTCPSEYVWGRALPYLRRAESPWDTGFINYECVNELRSEDIRLKLAAYDRNIEIPVDPARWFTELNADENGYVISVNIGKNTFSGGDIWRILGLRSTAFTVSYTDNIFTFTTKGFGHGAGLSQYGANEMAGSGSTADEILKHYYGNGVQLT